MLIRAKLPTLVAAVLAGVIAMPGSVHAQKSPPGDEPRAPRSNTPRGEAPRSDAPSLKKPPGPPPGHAPMAKGKGDTPAAKADTPPDTPQARAKLLNDLYAHLAAAEDEGQAKPTVQAIERLWLHSGSDTISLLMERALVAVNAKNPDLALKLLDAVVDLAPDFAEGWNRRAYVFYTQNNFERALGDLRRVLALDPNHFKALDGLAQIFKETGNKKAALKAMKELMQVHPFAPGLRDAVTELTREVEGQGI